MLSALTTAEKTLLATYPHRAKYYLAVLKPTPVWKARVNDSGIAQGEMTVKYDNVTLGTPGDVKIGMTLWVGSTEGARDLGKVRIKAIPDGTDIEVAENSDVPSFVVAVAVIRAPAVKEVAGSKGPLCMSNSPGGKTPSNPIQVRPSPKPSVVTSAM